LSATPEPVASATGGNSTGFGRWLVVLAAGLVVVSVLGYRVLRRNQAALAESAAANSLPEQAAPTTATSTATTAESAPAAPPAESAEQAPAAAAAEPGSSAAAPAPSASAAAVVASASSPGASTTAGESASTDLHRVTIKSKPPKVRFYHFGKLVGVTPFVLELKPGERHAYEAGLPGFGTRKVVIDGSKPEILIGLTREKP